MSKKKFGAILSVWSILFATVILLLNIPQSREYISYSYVRIGLLDSFMEQIRNGEIPEFLSAPEHSWGFVFYLPYLGVMLGIGEAWKLVLLLHLGLMWMLMAVFPAEIYLVTKKRYLALISPVMLHIFCGNVLYGYKCDSIWAAGWAMVITAPLLYKVYQEQNQKTEMIWVAVIGLLCSISNIMRNHCGFYTMVVLLFLLFVKYVRRMRKGCSVRTLLHLILLFVLFKVMYELISDTIPLLVGIVLHREILDNFNFLWHTILCGLGSYPNAFRLECDDNVVIALIGEKYPGVGKYTNAYLDACRDFFFQICKQDPVFVAKVWLTNFGKTLARAFEYEMTWRKKDDWYFYGVKFNIHNILIPAVLAVGGYIGAIVKKRRNGIVAEQQTMLFLFCCGLLILSGTIQAIFLIPVLRYYLPSCVGIGLFFFTIAMRAQELVYNEIKQKKFMRRR